MKYDFMLNAMGHALSFMIKNEITDKSQRKQILKEYKNIMVRADDIGNGNNLIMSYALAGFFIAMNRNDNLTPEENISILEKNMRNSKMVKMLMGDAESYLSEKHMESRRKWSALTHKKKYKNDWVVDVIEKTDDFEFGLDYTECGVCKLCRDEKCPELAKYLCRLDFMLVEIIGLHLDRTTTLADGFDKCDFRFKK